MKSCNTSFTMSYFHRSLGFPDGSDGKESAYNAGDLGSIPGLGRSPGEENGNPLQYSCWEIPWREQPGEPQSMGVTKSRTQLSAEHTSVKWKSYFCAF